MRRRGPSWQRFYKRVPSPLLEYFWPKRRPATDPVRMSSRRPPAQNHELPAVYGHSRAAGHRSRSEVRAPGRPHSPGAMLIRIGSRCGRV
jgi:hypothetical protein